MTRPAPPGSPGSPGSLEQDPGSLAMLEQAAAVVLAMVNIQGPPVLSPLDGGRNNRVFRVDVPAGSMVLKAYFQHQDDPRDRLDAEFAFVKQVWAMGLRNLPQPIARLPLRHLGLYGWIAGRPIAPGGVTKEHVLQAADFVLRINQRRHELAGASSVAELIVEDRPCMPEASDACFSLVEHLTSIERRLTRLVTHPAADDLDRQMLQFVERELVPAWRQATIAFRDAVQRDGGDLHEPVPDVDRVLSPSDFGFHNAIEREDGSVAFIDFEYAGWDDPAKLICDFLTQVAVPVPMEHASLFMHRFTACLKDAQAAQRRVAWLLPVYRIKWCCMALNAFLPVSADRQRYARPGEDHHQHRRRQLELARRLLASSMNRLDGK